MLTIFAALVIYAGIVLLVRIHSYRDGNHLARPCGIRASFIQAFEAAHDIGVVFFDGFLIRVSVEKGEAEIFCF
jgi:hypothetical protein